MNDDIPRIEFTDEIDLHRFNPRDARDILRDFLDHAESERYASVRIVHGKGRSVLKSMVYAELGNRPSVAAYHDDSSNWGATVAVMGPPRG